MVGCVFCHGCRKRQTVMDDAPSTLPSPFFIDILGPAVVSTMEYFGFSTCGGFHFFFDDKSGFKMDKQRKDK